jgi:hypothetical protein
MSSNDIKIHFVFLIESGLHGQVSVCCCSKMNLVHLATLFYVVNAWERVAIARRGRGSSSETLIM